MTRSELIYARAGSCPHCRQGVQFVGPLFSEDGGKASQHDGPMSILYSTSKGKITTEVIAVMCPMPACTRFSIFLVDSANDVVRCVYPGDGDRPVPIEVDNEHPSIASDFREAAAVLPFSPKASAALSRRCLQTLLREKAGVKPGNLDKEIEEAMKKLPPYLADAIDAIRQVGNFAAHPIKSQHTGEITEVEPEEAEWQLDTLERLFEHYYVEPAKLKAQRDALNAKLAAANKPLLKGSTP
jgi:hypothetical protein